MQAFILLNLANASLSVGRENRSGSLALECVTVEANDTDRKATSNRDVFLVLRIDSLETPLDPLQRIQCSSRTAQRRYLFVDGNGEQVIVQLPEPGPGKDNDHIREDLETFDSILSQYAEFKGPDSSSQSRPPLPLRASSIVTDNKDGDLRGHVILMDEDSGQVVGELENKFTVEKDPSHDPNGSEEEPVVIELRNEAGEPEEDPRAVFIRAIPEGHGNYITKGASLVSYAISGTTNMLTSAMTSASTFYIKNSQAYTESPSSSSKSPADGAPPLPPRALVLLTSERTRKGLATMHAVSGQVASVSSKTAKTIGVLEQKVTRAVVGKGKEVYTQMSGSTLVPPLPPRTLSTAASPVHSREPTPEPYSSSPPPYAVYAPRHPPALPQRAPPTSKVNSNLPPPSNSRRLVASAELILDTIDTSTKQLVDVGSKQLGAVMGHRYGADAEQSTNYLTGTARNVVLVFIDVKGVGRRALIRNAGKAAGKEIIAGRRKTVEVSTPTSSEKYAIQVKA
ncbi:hypothetical protein HWV62_45019 [Athelia sp. TMB]|nr:hypothetical protein HWV62_45019 [Athelia sp. TMB]